MNRPVNLRIYFASALVPIALLAAQCGFAASPVMPGVTLRLLPNGLRLLVREQHSTPLVAVDAWVRAGSGREREGESGAAHFLEHLLFKGTPTRKPGEIDGAIEDLGASLSAFTSRQAAHYATTVPAEHAQTAIGVIADALRNSLLDPKEMERERSVILDEIARSRNDAHKDVVNGLFAQLLGTNGYARPVLGKPETIQSITRDTVAEFYRRWYTPGNTTLVVVGDITPDRAEELAKSAFGSWSGSSPANTEMAAESVARAGVNEKQVVTASSPGVPVGREVGAVGFLIRQERSGPEVAAGLAAAAVLQNAVRNRIREEPPKDSAHPRVARPIAKEGEADVSVEIAPGQGFSLLALTGTVPAGAGGDLLNAVTAEVERLAKDAPSATELDAAVRQVIGPYLYDIETYGGQAGALGLYDVLGEFSTAQKLEDQLLALKPADISAYVQKRLVSENRADLLATPATRR